MVSGAFMCAFSVFVRFGLHQRLRYFSAFEAWGTTWVPMIFGVWVIVFGLMGYLHQRRHR
jgi:hypothetical protein